MKKKVVIIISVILIVLVMVSVLFSMKKDDVTVTYTEDEIKFKDEYEKVNGMELSSDYVLKNITIPNDNNVVYLSDNNIVEKLTKGTNVIYFGWADCNWCRTALPVLLDTLKENNIDTLYYYDFKSLRNAYENGDEEKSKIYENIISIIGNDINTYFDEDSSRKDMKKMLVPTVVFIKNGDYIGLHFKTVDSQVNSTDELNKEQVLELKHSYQSLIDQINASVCTTDEGC